MGQCDPQEGRIALFEMLPPSAALTMGTADPRRPETPPGYEPGPSVVPELAARLGIPRITLRSTQSFEESECRANKGGNDAGSQQVLSLPSHNSSWVLQAQDLCRPTFDGGLESSDSRPRETFGAWELDGSLVTRWQEN